MEEYSDIENDTFDAPDATDATDAIATAEGQQYETQLQTPPGHLIRADNEGNKMGKAGILKATSGNRAKQLKPR